jgi:LysM repeat protein
VRQLLWYNRDLRATKAGRVVPGQTALLPSSAVVAAALDVPDPAVERYGSAGRGTVTHVVKRGESLGSIARRYHTTVAALQRLNGLKKSVIFPGQVILVKGSPAHRARRAVTARSGGARAARGAAPSERQVHVVRAGETLSSIARQYHMTVAELKQLNGMTSSALQPGRRLVVRG